LQRRIGPHQSNDMVGYLKIAALDTNGS
jgi:hypothetical protein